MSRPVREGQTVAPDDARGGAQALPAVPFRARAPRGGRRRAASRLLVEGQTWTQDEWWIAGEARKAPRLTAVYEMTPGGGEAGVADGEENESLFENALRAPALDARRRRAGEAATTGVKRSSRVLLARSRTMRLIWNQSVFAGPRRTRWRTCTATGRTASARPPTASRPSAPTPSSPAFAGSRALFRLKTRWPRNPDGSDDCAVDVPLPHNSVCVMLPGCQELWTHEILRDGAAGGGAGGRRESRERRFAKGGRVGRERALVPMRAEVRAENETRGRGGSCVRTHVWGRHRGRGNPRPPGGHARAVLLHVRFRERREAVRVFQTRRDAAGVSNTAA